VGNRSPVTSDEPLRPTEALDEIADEELAAEEPE
jgi:hypothetical protein